MGILAIRSWGVTALPALVLALGAPERSEATAVFEFVDAGPEIVGTLSGSLDFSGRFNAPGGTTPGFVGIDTTNAFLSTTDSLFLDFYALDVVASPWGAGPPIGGVAAGDGFNLTTTGVGVPNGYVDGAPLSATLTLPVADFDNLGVTFTGPGDLEFTSTADGGDTIVLRFVQPAAETATQVPLPAPAALLGAGALGLGLLRRRRRRRRA